MEKKPMLTVAQALQTLLQAVRPLQEIEQVSTLAANGRVLALAQNSGLYVPPMDNTQMDGYAVRAADCESGCARLKVSQRIPAGVIGEPLQAGTVARIFTGAFIPVGADAVVMQEQCEVEKLVDSDGEHTFVTIHHQVQARRHCRRAAPPAAGASAAG